MAVTTTRLPAKISACMIPQELPIACCRTRARPLERKVRFCLLICLLVNGMKLNVIRFSVLEEDVRQYCIWRQENATFKEKGLPNWWRYTEQFMDKGCSSIQGKMTA